MSPARSCHAAPPLQRCACKRTSAAAHAPSHCADALQGAAIVRSEHVNTLASPEVQHIALVRALVRNAPHTHTHTLSGAAGPATASRVVHVGVPRKAGGEFALCTLLSAPTCCSSAEAASRCGAAGLPCSAVRTCSPRVRAALVAAAVEAFYTRDATEIMVRHRSKPRRGPHARASRPVLQLCNRMPTFPPQPLVPLAPRFTRCMFAQLSQQRFLPPKCFRKVSAHCCRAFPGADAGMRCCRRPHQS